MSGDKAMQAAVMAGDLNSDLAELVFGDLFDRTQIDDVTSKSYAMRQSVKTGFLGWCYGAGSRKVAESIGLPEEQGQAIVDRWVRAFPDMGRYKDDLNQERMVILPSGRWCPLWDRYTVGPEGELVLRPRPSRCGLNYMTQGSARDLLATAIHRFIAMNPDYGHYLWNFVHDEVLICVPAERAEEVGNALAKAMTFRLHGVPIEAEPEVLGQRWGKVPAELVITEDDEELELVAA